jgi:hypothetical protein
MKLSNATTTLLGAAAALLAVSSANAQVFYSETFDTDGAGWTGGLTYFNNATACSTGAMRDNLYGSVPNGQLLSPVLGTSAGGVTTISYSYKVHDWSPNTSPTAGSWGSIAVEYADNAAGPWTNIATTTDEVQTTSCIVKTHTFTPPAGALFVRFDCNRTSGDSWYNIDDISISEAGANPPASHTNYGSGCYDIATNQAIYQNFPDALTSAAALAGTSITFTPTANGYTVSNGGGVYVAPTVAATLIPLADDASAAFTPSVPFPHVGGAVIDLEVHSNCFVSMGPGNANNVYGSVPAMIGSPVASVRANFDLNPAIAGSAVSAEEIGNVLHITWEAPRFNFTLAEIERVQMQLNLSTGSVVMVWDTLASAGSTGDTVVGYAPGVSMDPGAINLATDLPITTVPDTFIPAISMSASPAPVSTGSTGTTVIYQIDDIPDAQVSSGIYFGAVLISFAPDLAGSPLDFLGMPGCNLYIANIDVPVMYVGATTSQTVNVDIPSGIAVGTEIWAQAVAMVFPGSLPNGQNAYGAVVSNGVASFISDN